MIYKFKEYKKSPVLRGHLNMGGENPYGEKFEVTSLCFERGGKPYIPVMGEYHFSRDKCENWYDELCKMKAGGVDIVATYVFWIYHEENEGDFDFTGDRDIRRFVLEAQRAGLDVFIRIGPWCHGECRNGGFPDWLVEKPFKKRDNNDEYMAKVRIWYEKIFNEVKGLFYKDGGRIIGVQFENELVNNPGHLLALKKLALEIGYAAPVYTVTGWNSLYGAKIPVDEVVPVFAAYAEAPWAGHREKLAPSPHYAFDTMRNDSAVGLDIIKPTDNDGWVLPYERYPFATCELGAGIHPTHHRRGMVTDMDAYAMSLVKLGCGNNLIGYYMYHGGVNKIGKKSTFNESKETGYPNDYPILNYDYNTALSAYGEAGGQHGMLNMLHMFVQSFGERLATMESVGAEHFVKETDFDSLRYCMRTDGKSGFIFVNHYQRLYPVKDVFDVVFDTGEVIFPSVDVVGDVSFILPFNLEMGDVVLEYATAQPLCNVGDTYFFAQIPDVEREFKFKDCTGVFRGANFVYAGKRIVTLSYEDAKYLRVLDSKVYVGDNCNLYLKDGKLCCIEKGDYSYREWAGEDFESYMVDVDYDEAEVYFSSCEEPFLPPYGEQLNFGGERKREWKKIYASSPCGFFEVGYKYDVAQLYVNGELVADNFYCSKPWRVPARLVFMKEAYLVMSEMKDDFYKEF
ncbi:MAG: beta-galactosidase [Clostridia bacterium]|nr:beta-galactosidase [Clostridia bacterium]